MLTRIPFALIAVMFACSLYALPARAQRARVFVASYGSDSNPCTFGSPCKTFQNAVNVVASGGEVTAIDSAGFGPINITKPVTITSPDGIEAGVIPLSGDDAITINVSGDVLLRGLTIEGGDSSPNGINMTGGGSLRIVRCSVRHFTHDGIYLQPTETFSVSISDTLAANNGNDGFDLSPSGSGSIDGVIDHSTAFANGNDGFMVYGQNASAGFAEIGIVESIATQNGGSGIRANTIGGQDVVKVTARDTSAIDNTIGFRSDGSATLILAHVTATSNGDYGIEINSGATGDSFGDNHVFGNGGTDVVGTITSAGFH
jgi:hypothetical protein